MYKERSLRSVYQSAATIARENSYAETRDGRAGNGSTTSGVGAGGAEPASGESSGAEASGAFGFSGASPEARLAFLRSVPLFHYLPEDQLKNASLILEPAAFEDGEVIVRQGDTVGRSDGSSRRFDASDDGEMNGMFYIITGGEAKVFIRSQTSRAARDHHGVVVARLTPGDIFGHTALLPGSSGIRGGTVTADAVAAHWGPLHAA